MAERHWELKAIEAARAVLRRKAETYYIGDASVLLAEKEITWLWGKFIRPRKTRRQDVGDLGRRALCVIRPSHEVVLRS